ncbi:M14 family metallopeptidase [Paenibacillus sp. YSY-4.3]
MSSKRRAKLWLPILTAILSLAILSSFVSANSGDIVRSDVVMSYERMTSHIADLAERYPEIIEYKSIGKTPYGREIWAVKLGQGEAAIFINGSHHAREWLTTTINLQMIEQYAKAYRAGTAIEGYDARKVLNETTIWFVPMVNPDGVTLQQSGLKVFPENSRNALLQMNQGSKDFTRWKANAQGVDLNRQYPADWNTIHNNAAGPNWMNYKGAKPLQTAENQSLVNFTYEIQPEIAVSYHSAGRILYWNYKTAPANLERDRKLAQSFAAKTGYSLVQPTSNPSGGGYTDWFISTFGRPAFTPEIGIKTGEAHLPLSAFAEEWKRNKGIGIWLADEGYRLWLSSNRNRAEQPLEEGALTITEARDVYSEPNFLSKATTRVSPQTLQAAAKVGNWYKIQTDDGTGWIYEPHPRLGTAAEVVDATIELKQETGFYEQPFDRTTEKGRLAPMIVQASKKWDDWYLVMTPIGEYWIEWAN